MCLNFTNSSIHLYNQHCKRTMEKRSFLRCLSFIVASLLLLSIVSCEKEPTEEQIYASLFSKTDYFIDMLDEIYEHYDAFGSRSTDTSDGKYKVTPMGRLIIVKKNSSAGDVSYEKLAEILKRHYKKNRTVNDVFVNNGGTVTIDCRN